MIDNINLCKVHSHRLPVAILGLILSLVLFFCHHEASAQKSKKTNIIFIMADDLGYEAIQVNGGESYRTPYLNRMAQQGMRFTNAHATPLCTPTRIQVMTGKYNHRNYKAFGIIDTLELAFGHLMRQAGYRTGIAGKWQLDGNKMQREMAGFRGAYPEEMGFDDYFLWNLNYEQGDWRYKDPVINTKDGKKRYHGKYGPDLFLQWSKNFIEENKDQPFFLYYSMVLTHDPFQPTPKNPEFDQSSPVGKGDPKYFGEMVSYMDSMVNEIILKVRDLGIAENTLIIFTGDNGTSRKVVSMLEGKRMRGGKGTTKLTGTHVPFIVLWDGTVKPGQVNDNLVDFTDIVPTFLETANFKKPKSFHTDGISLYRQLLNMNSSVKRERVFCHYDPKWGNVVPATWIHNKEWKLYATGEFYNLVKDPDEKDPIPLENISKSEKKIRESLYKEMSKILKPI